ncbi:MAG: diaminopimelate epimerase [Steroidobacteraceae bacterium]
MLCDMRIEFSKMQGLGNDFVIFDAPSAMSGPFDPKTLRAMADRHTGIGFDQALVLEPPLDPKNRAAYRIFNADGGEVEQCGNGARCVAALLHARRPELGDEMRLESIAGIVHARVRADGWVSVQVGVPDFAPRSLPMRAPEELHTYCITIDGVETHFGALSMGNPHVVVRVADVATAPVGSLGPAISNHAWFPKRTNVGFMEIVDRARIRLRVYERGAGETLACGTGACAAVAVGRRAGLLDDEVRAELPGGTAFVACPGTGEPVWLTGPATLVFTGTIDI